MPTNRELVDAALAIPTWQDRIGIPNRCKPNTGEEAAMCSEIAELRDALARISAAITATSPARRCCKEAARWGG